MIRCISIDERRIRSYQRKGIHISLFVNRSMNIYTSNYIYLYLSISISIYLNNNYYLLWWFRIVWLSLSTVRSSVQIGFPSPSASIPFLSIEFPVLPLVLCPFVFESPSPRNSLLLSRIHSYLLQPNS